MEKENSSPETHTSPHPFTAGVFSPHLASCPIMATLEKWFVNPEYLRQVSANLGSLIAKAEDA